MKVKLSLFCEVFPYSPLVLPIRIHGLKSIADKVEEFEDLDEIIARYIQPMAAFARDITNHKYYVESEGGKLEVMEKIVQEEQNKAPSK